VSKTRQSPPPEQPPDPLEWFPIEELPVDDPAAEFLVRASKKGRPLAVKFRKTRGYDDAAMRYVPKMILIDAQMGTKLSFKPVEFAIPQTEAV
jgi:hypothetical protein